MPRLIEKDYFCTVLLLDHLCHGGGEDLVFKGGTCLTKVHSELYRLSEDLDYTIPVPVEDFAIGTEQTSGSCERRFEPIEANHVPAFRVIEP